jgi:hypothetical protein
MARKPGPETPLYVRLPNAAVEKLDRAAEVLGMHKKDLVAGLVAKYIEPYTDSVGPRGSQRRPPLDTSDGGPMIGSYSFQPYEPPEIMNAEQAGQFLQIAETMVVELAETGKLPGKKLGPVWRFSRDALVAWLSTPEKR